MNSWFNGIRVYIAGAFTKNTEANVNRAMKAWHRLTDLGYVGYCPHLNLLLGLQETRPYELWLAHDKEWMHLCHVMLRLQGDESPGADREEKEFQGLIFHSIEELEAWRKSLTEEELMAFLHPSDDIQNDVAEFHLMIGQGVPEHPEPLDEEVAALRSLLVREEAAELIKALAGGDLAKIGQEAVDLIYVVVGTLVAAGLDMGPIWSMVHRANMAKDPDPQGRKAKKPEGWTPPDVAGEVERQIGAMT